MKHAPFVADIKALRKSARQHLERGPITESYTADLSAVIKLLNEALATEVVCVLRYMHHYYADSGIHGDVIKKEFLEHANEEQTHADLIAKRIVQLGGKPDLSPASLVARSHAEYTEGDTLRQMVEEDLVAERIAIESYRAMITYLENDDPTTRRMLEEILAKEEEHAEDLQSLLPGMK